MSPFGHSACWPRMRAVLAACLLALAGCAVVVEPANLVPAVAGQPAARIRMSAQSMVRLGTGHDRAIDAGSLWRRAGTLAQGEVYRPVDSVFMIVGSNAHEAWLVLREHALVGFYLPGESHFSPLVPVLPLSYETLGDPS